jgi:hypothetical protein
MDAPALRLIQRRENISKAAAAAQKLFLSSSTGSLNSVSQRTETKSLAVTQMGSAGEGNPEQYSQALDHSIELTGQELVEESRGNDQAHQISESDIVPGDPIFVLWKNRIWYPATCISNQHRRVEFRWLDPGNFEATGSANQTKVRRRIVGTFKIATGTPIYVKWSEDNMWYPAKFLSKHANKVQFTWETPGEYEATGSVDPCHVRIMISESAVHLNPSLLPSEDAVRRFTKDISTSNRQEAASTRSSIAFSLLTHYCSSSNLYLHEYIS